MESSHFWVYRSLLSLRLLILVKKCYCSLGTTFITMVLVLVYYDGFGSKFVQIFFFFCDQNRLLQ